MPNVPISGLEINETEDQLLTATFGRGIWKSTHRDPCPSTLNISSNISGLYFRSASNYITTTSTLVGGEGTDAAFFCPPFIS